jgi:hypothetical protein
LVVSGRVVRTTGNKVGVRMTQHEFRTAGVSAERRSDRNDLSLVSRNSSTMVARTGTDSTFGKVQ